MTQRENRPSKPAGRCTRFLSGAIALMACSGALLAAQPGLPSAAEKEIDRVANAAVEKGQSAGIVIGISKSGALLFSRGYGKANLELDCPMISNSEVRIASVTKQFTAAAILSLVQDGKLSLDDPLEKFIPGFPGAKTVTIKELLNHTSGIRDYTKIPNFAGKDWRIDRTPQEMIDYIATQSPLYDFPPGTAAAYSNSAYQLLGFIIEKVSGMPLKQYYQTRLFEPIGLRDTAVDDLGDIVPGRAAGYERASTDSAQLRNAQYISMSAAGAAGFMRSTVGDLLKWTAALFDGRVIRMDLVRLMTEPATLSDGHRVSEVAPFKFPDGTPAGPPLGVKFDRGLGLDMEPLDGHERIGHSGSIPGFAARMDFFPRDEVAVVVVVNTDGGMRDLSKTVEGIALKYLAADTQVKQKR
jgi:D-alanyl-D-alanine carboxypeptidase